jgi:hypothetical protein
LNYYLTSDLPVLTEPWRTRIERKGGKTARNVFNLANGVATLLTGLRFLYSF